MRRMPMLLTTIAMVGVMITAGCTSGNDTTSESTPKAVITPTTGTSVISRSPSPAETDAPGIDFTQGSLSVTMHNHTFNISAHDWNTITTASIVPRDISVSLDSDFHATQTTRNRFQYLADRMLPYITSKFGAIGIVSVVKNSHTDVTIAALINPTDNAYQLTGFSETIIKGPPATTVASAKFYSTPATALIIPGHDIYFLWLSASVLNPPPAKVTDTSFNFSWDRLYNCGQAACPQGSA
jgi:hypothetical protein